MNTPKNTVQVHRTIRTIQILVFVIVITVVGLLIRSALESHAALADFKSCAAAKLSSSCIDTLREAARWHFLGNPYSIEARQILMRLTQEGDATIAPLASDALYQARASARSVFEPAPSELYSLNAPMQLCAHLFFFLWIGAVLRGIWKGFDSNLKPSWVVLCRHAWIAIGSYLLWLVALRFA